MDYLWVYEGAVDAAGRVLTLETEGPNVMGGGGTARFREEIELVDRDNRAFRSNMQNADGTWTTIMSAHYRRTR